MEGAECGASSVGRLCRSRYVAADCAASSRAHGDPHVSPNHHAPLVCCLRCAAASTRYADVLAAVSPLFHLSLHVASVYLQGRPRLRLRLVAFAVAVVVHALSCNEYPCPLASPCVSDIHVQRFRKSQRSYLNASETPSFAYSSCLYNQSH